MDIGSENAAGCKALDGTDSDDVAEARCRQQRGMTQATEERRVGKLSAFIGVLDRGLANADGDHVAHDHHQGNLGGP